MRLCEQFGFDAAWRQAQLTLIGLDEYLRADVARLHSDVLTADVSDEVVGMFYSQLMRNSEAAELLSRGEPRERQLRHLKTLGVGYRTIEYFENRARVGVAHARVGVPLSLYLESFGIMQNLILEAIARELEERDDRLAALVLRLTSLDIALATETYHRYQLQLLGRSLSKSERARLSLQALLDHDALTDVASRQALLRALDASVTQANNENLALAVIVADLDNFKGVNDTYGHLVGDQALKEVAARIMAALRDGDIVGRYGGEEFVILLHDTGPETAEQIAERVRRRISEDPLHLAGRRLQMTISQGISMHRPGDDAVSILDRADKAMYQAKLDGRDRVVLGA